jgi:hypothetical protein
METYAWSDTVPTSEEIRRYQSLPHDTPMPHIVRSVEDQNILGGAVHGATYATKINYQGEDALVYISPELTSLPRDNHALRNRMPFLRAKVISSLSAAGYWHTALRGVAFRSYLRGNYWNETIWTGGVIGWRQSSSGVPMYYASTESATGVRALVVLGGYDDVDQISKYNPDMHSTGYKVVCESNTETYNLAFRVGEHFRDHILNANYGRRYYTGDVQGAFLDFQNPPPAQPASLAMPDSARAAILLLLAGQGIGLGW